MNERIKQLLYDARIFDGSGYMTQSIDTCPESLEKFAELIVRECADIAKHHVMNISTYADADFVDEQIKEHFGVEARRSPTKPLG